MAKNPVEEFLLEKRALGINMSGLAQKAGPAARRAGGIAGTAALTGAGAAAFAGLTGAAGKIYMAATKTRDFRNMMEANPDLQEHQLQDPAGFNRMFSALRTMAPEFTQEPLVAGSYMRHGMESSPEDRGNVAVRAMRERQFPKAGPATEAAMGGFMSGLKAPGGDKKQLTKQTKSVFKPTEGGDPTLERIEEAHNYYG